MIVDNFGTLKVNPYRWYTPRYITGIVDEAANLSEWEPAPLMVVPDAMIAYQPPKETGRHVTTDPACSRHHPPATRWQRRRFDRARGVGCPVCTDPTKGPTA